MRLKNKCLFPALLIIISLIVCIANYKTGTFLSGWDTLHPEFNFGEYFKRIFSVWQEHQGLGAVAAQAHASELPRAVLMFFLSFLLPQSFLRYSYFFLTLIVGPVGVYYFVKHFTTKNGAFLAGLFYLLNLTTVQQFSVPLEMFAALYGFIGWIFLFAAKYIMEQKKKNLRLFCLFTILSSPMAHTPTLFYIFFLCISFFLLTLAFLLKKIKRAVLLILLLISLNSYWILPNLYFIKFYSASVADSKIHSQFSDRAFQVSRNFGDVADTAIMKNFLFDWGEYNNLDGSFVYLLKLWSKHLSSLPIKIISYIIFLLILVGVLITIRKKEKIGLSLLPVFAVSYFFIAYNNVFIEALRFPFTKFSILLLFCYSVYFGIAMAKQKLIIMVIVCGSVIFYMWPIFSGNLINSKMKVDIPKYYFNVFDYFKSQPAEGRIALFPVHTFWGWSYHNWGYEGAGFLWFGIKQPVMSREFDRWHPANEQFYWEISYASYHEDLKLLESVLDKYQIKYLLLDFSITDASSAKSVYLGQFKKLLSYSKKIKQIKNFGEIRIYQVENQLKSKNFISGGSLPKIGPKFERTDIDSAFANYGQYKSSDNPDVFYPFRSLFTNHTNQKMDFDLTETAGSFLFKKKLPDNIKNYRLNIPDNSKLLWLDNNNLDNQGIFLPKINFNGQSIIVEVPKVKGYFSREINPNIKLAKNCDFLRLSQDANAGEVKNEIINGKLIRFFSKLANNCSGVFNLDTLSHNQSYIITFENRNIKNKTLLFWLENINLRRSDLEVYLPPTDKLTKFYFIQPPLDPYGTGYTLHFDNWSFNKSASINDLGEITVYPIPYTFLTNLTLTKASPAPAYLNSLHAQHPLPYLYIAKVSKEQDLVLYQSFDLGWYAFGASDHFLVNNWANGWKVNKEGAVVIFFLPQLLEFLGFGILIVALYTILRFNPMIKLFL